MVRFSEKQAKALELGQIRKNKKEKGITVFQRTLTEAEVLSQVKTYLQVKGWLVMRIHQSLGSQRGLPDLICLNKDGKTVYIECKSQSKKAKQSTFQKELQQQIESRDGIYVVARGIEDIEKMIHLC